MERSRLKKLAVTTLEKVKEQYPSISPLNKQTSTHSPNPPQSHS